MSENVNGVYKVVAGYLATALLSAVVAYCGAYFTFPEPMAKDDIKQALVESFTEVSNERGMYVIEGRPRLESVEYSIRALESQQTQILNSNARIEAKLDLMKDR